VIASCAVVWAVRPKHFTPDQAAEGCGVAGSKVCPALSKSSVAESKIVDITVRDDRADEVIE